MFVTESIMENKILSMDKGNEMGMGIKANKVTKGMDNKDKEGCFSALNSIDKEIDRLNEKREEIKSHIVENLTEFKVGDKVVLVFPEQKGMWARPAKRDTVFISGVHVIKDFRWEWYIDYTFNKCKVNGSMSRISYGRPFRKYSIEKPQS